LSHLFFLAPLLLFVGAVLQGSTQPAQFSNLPPDGPFERIVVSSPALRAGETQEVQVTLRGGSGQLTILTLKMVYPDGATEQILHSTMGSEATITWQVPPDAGAGVATFYLSKGDCGCGERSLRTQNVLPAGMVEGRFTIVNGER
jgi:hypothetical protein